MYQSRKRLTRFLAMLLSLAMVLPALAPAAAYAAESSVRIEEHAFPAEQNTQVSGLVIDGVEEPQSGEALDDAATVTSQEGESWDIPVLWLDASLQLSVTARDGRDYLPVLAFFVPSGYGVQGADDAGGYDVTLARDLVRLFKGNDIITIYDDSTDITYILPAALRSYFARSQQSADSGTAAAATAGEASSQGQGTAPSSSEQAIDYGRAWGGDNATDLDALALAHCSMTAKDALDWDDLTYLTDLIINKLQPQAVNLLLEKFPAFDAANKKGEIGKQIGLYIYFEKGDKDGDPAHEDAIEDALAYVSGRYARQGKTNRYGYMIAVDASSCTAKNAKGQLVLVRDGVDANTLENTIVHEMFHAFMDDYNRTGMVGIASAQNAILDYDHISDAQFDVYKVLHYPHWFIEGTASAVENVYNYRNNLFTLLAQETDTYRQGSSMAILSNYVSVRDKNDKPVIFGLPFSNGGTLKDGSPVNTTPSRYVTGYLATLYLGELAARATTGSAIEEDDDNLTIWSEPILLGLNTILEQMHKGKSLDEVIAEISPVDKNGNKLYSSTAEFEEEFITGPAVEDEDGDSSYYGDDESLEFVRKFLFYMDALSQQETRVALPNGSILFNFHADYVTPLDRDMTATGKAYTITDSDTYVNSTVGDKVALKGGGKSPKAELEVASEAGDVAQLPLAAKAEAGESSAAEAAADRAPADVAESACAEAAVASSDGPCEEAAPTTTEPVAEAIEQPSVSEMAPAPAEEVTPAEEVPSS